MNRADVLSAIESSLEEPLERGTLRGDERCDELEGWSSLAVLSFMSAMNKAYGITLPPARILACRKVDDVVDLVAATIGS